MHMQVLRVWIHQYAWQASHGLTLTEQKAACPGGVPSSEGVCQMAHMRMADICKHLAGLGPI